MDSDFVNCYKSERHWPHFFRIGENIRTYVAEGEGNERSVYAAADCCKVKCVFQWPVSQYINLESKTLSSL